MLSNALMFVVAGLMAGALHLAGVPLVAVQISWILFLIGINPGRYSFRVDASYGARDLSQDTNCKGLKKH